MAKYIFINLPNSLSRCIGPYRSVGVPAVLWDTGKRVQWDKSGHRYDTPEELPPSSTPPLSRCVLR